METSSSGDVMGVSEKSLQLFTSLQFLFPDLIIQMLFVEFRKPADVKGCI